MTVPVLSVSPAGAAQAYARVADAKTDPGQGFSQALGRALEGAVQTGHAADLEATRAITGGGNLTEVTTAVSRAELALQGVIAIRDKVVTAYQDVMRMAI